MHKIKVPYVGSMDIKQKKVYSISWILNQRASTLSIVALFVFLLLQNPLSQFVPNLELYDELLFFVICGVALGKVVTDKVSIRTKDFNIVICVIAITLIGIFGNVLSQYQNSITAIAKDIMAFAKFPLVFIAANYIFKKSNTHNAVIICNIICKIFISICFVFAAFNTIHPVEMLSHDFRHGIWSFKFIYTHPTFLVYALVMCFVILSTISTKLDMYKLMCLVLLALTMRDKAFGFIGLVLFARLIGIKSKKRFLPFLFLAGIVVLCIAWPKIGEYLSYSNSPRQAMYSASFDIAKTFFPAGSGFATIASSISGEYYSNVYYAYHMSDMSGLTPQRYTAAGDAGFAYYLGEFGFIGFVLFLIILLLYFRISIQQTPINAPARFSFFLLFGYVIIALTVETVLTNATGVSIAILTVLIINSSDKNSTSDSIFNQRK
ncbi:oligosaccharide repeat unit polymerase Wzy [Bifidobacterium pullorum subsp. saeculare DSM 6531 = LMG 14934]|uniref:Oligosaccharide repeat unit polymerase Wzy n=2 Tax=Bifidobacterium pullorum TaxID=78448 RepID=A0A087CTF0_9BIFI|nr:oligosaccharide repeat unit polymerase Wzy [Bifidobacterium pullorum subsp. saeculare DSM 6531 = LMG 14934]